MRCGATAGMLLFFFPFCFASHLFAIVTTLAFLLGNAFIPTQPKKTKATWANGPLDRANDY